MDTTSRNRKLGAAVLCLLLLCLLAWLLNTPDVSTGRRPDTAAPSPQAEDASSATKPHLDTAGLDPGAVMSQGAPSEAEKRDSTGVRCAFRNRLGWTPNDGHLRQTGDRFGYESPVLGRIDHFWLSDIDFDGSGTISSFGAKPLSVQWVAGSERQPGHCLGTYDLVAENTRLTGRVTGPGSEKGVSLSFTECVDITSQADENGAFDQTVSAGQCKITALWTDGWVPVQSPEVTINIKDGTTAYVELVLPEKPQGLPGFFIDPTAANHRVLYIFPGSAADEEDLRPGDIITEIDGEPTVDMDHYEFGTWDVGDLGTTVTVTAERKGRSKIYTLERRAIPKAE